MPLKNSSDQRFIRGIAQGNPFILKEIYATYQPAITKLVESNNGSMEDAQDVFQEGLTVVYRKARTEDFRLTSSFLTYFYSVCRFIWLKKLRKKSRAMVTFEDTMGFSNEHSVEADFLKKERYALYIDSLKKLGEGCQKVLSLYAQSVSMKEIARQMGYASENYAKKRKFSCKKKLLLLIEQDKRYSELRTL